MILAFFKVDDDPRKALKKLDNMIHSTETAAIYRECSIMAPEFLVDYGSYIWEANYLAVGVVNGEERNKAYYFITDRILLPGGRAVVICKRDVLTTWWSHIRERKANVIRQESEAHFKKTSRFIFDDKMVGKSNTNFNHVPFPNSTTMFKIPWEGNEYSYVLTVLGGINNPPPESTTRAGDDND